jgi:DNA invertase Pin-like site-specific DNA recombinase
VKHVIKGPNVELASSIGTFLPVHCDGAIDTTTPSGELIFLVFSALAQFERRLIQERTNAGLAAARARGRKGGRPPIDSDAPRVVLANKLFRDKSVGADDICATLKISRSTLHRYVAISMSGPITFG